MDMNSRLLEFFRPLRYSDFRRFCTASLVSSAGTYAATVALSFAILEKFSPAALATVLLVREIPTIALVLLGGVVGDRVSRKLLLGITSSIQALSQLAVALVLIVGGTSVSALLMLVGLTAINGAATGFSRPATSGIIPEIMEPEDFQAANSLLGALPRLAGIGGAAFGALLYSTVGAAWGLLFDSLTFLIAAALYFSMRITARTRKPSAAVWASFMEGWKTVKSTRWIWLMIVSFGLFQVAYFPAVSVLGPSVSRTAYGGAESWAFVLAGGLGGALIGLIVVGLIRPRRPLVVASALGVVSALQIAALAGEWSLPLVVLFAIGSGVCVSIGDTLWLTTLQRFVDEDKLSRVSSFDWIASLGLNPIGFALIVPMSVALGDSLTLVLCAALLVVAALGPLLSRDIRAINLSRRDWETASR